MRILLVDDNEQIRDLLKIGLRHLGDAAPAENGLEAVEMYRRAWLEGKPFGFVTMDCEMPVLDGLTAISRIRSFEKTQMGNLFNTTICIVSAEDRCLKQYEERNGADNNLFFVRKPFKFECVRRIASIALSKVHSIQLHSLAVAVQLTSDKFRPAHGRGAALQTSADT